MSGQNKSKRSRSIKRTLTSIMMNKTSDIETVHVDNHIVGNAVNEQELLEGTCFCVCYWFELIK